MAEENSRNIGAFWFMKTKDILHKEAKNLVGDITYT